MEKNNKINFLKNNHQRQIIFQTNFQSNFRRIFLFAPKRIYPINHLAKSLDFKRPPIDFDFTLLLNDLLQLEVTFSLFRLQIIFSKFPFML